jgi:hypothetical protein
MRGRRSRDRDKRGTGEMRVPLSFFVPWLLYFARPQSSLPQSGISLFYFSVYFRFSSFANAFNPVQLIHSHSEVFRGIQRPPFAKSPISCTPFPQNYLRNYLWFMVLLFIILEGFSLGFPRTAVKTTNTPNCQCQWRWRVHFERGVVEAWRREKKILWDTDSYVCALTIFRNIIFGLGRTISQFLHLWVAALPSLALWSLEAEFHSAAAVSGVRLLSSSSTFD